MNLENIVSFQNLSDKHHCRCFKISPTDIILCKKNLIELGFEPQIAEENHGQLFGLKRKILELLQIHVKVMPNGIIESELEPPPEYPFAHMNEIHSYPPHEGMPILFELLKIKYEIIQPVPDTCHLPTIIDPDSPLKWWHILIIGIAAVGISYVIVKALKK